MRIEMIITAAQLPKDGLTLIQQEMERRVWESYPNARIRIRKGANNHLEIYAPKDDKKAANIIVEQMFNEAEEWLYA
ncbi:MULTISPECIES: DinI-like family protein [Aliivibrio]|uniref:Damage-inducible protein DinI n=1 Tax=Aliivibrio logei TaxID=688 RepID=A0A1B9NZZ2_ALILO|nr:MULTISPECIES: DinI-like family protein [Aliivibrio]MBB1315277.1 DinI-like family protein [Aliivibrio sp. SR45-2]OCH21682.1 damage-inducible protein DinI [Aliivibrio logei]